MHALGDVVIDDAVVAQREQRRLLGGEELAHHVLVGNRLRLDGAVAVTGVAGAEAVASEPEDAPQALGGLGGDRPVQDELLEPGERSLGGLDARLRLLPFGAAVVSSPSTRISPGSVSPWMTSVARMTVKVRKMMSRARSGNRR